MKKMLLMAALLVGTFCAVAADKELNLLCVGNSFTRCATKYLPDIVKTFPDCKINLYIVYAGGTNLEYHWNRVDKAENDPNAVYCKYKGKPIATFKDLLAAEKWDVVVPIQQYGPDPETFSEAQCEPYATNLYNYVKKHSPNSEIMIHQTWAYRPDWVWLKRFGGYQGMYDLLWNRYETMAKKFNVKLLPSGAAMKLCQDKHPFVIDPDFNYAAAEFNYENGKRVGSFRFFEKPGDLPKESWSMHVGPVYNKNKDGSDKYRFVVDCEHAGIRGEYIMGCLWFEMLYGKDARTITFKPEGLNDDEARELRNLAHETATTFVQPKDAK